MGEIPLGLSTSCLFCTIYCAEIVSQRTGKCSAVCSLKPKITSLFVCFNLTICIDDRAVFVGRFWPDEREGLGSGVGGH